MINLKNMNISDEFGVEYLYITFEITDTVESLENYNFNLYKSNNAISEFVPIAFNVADFKYRDFAVNLRNFTINYYYKIQIKNKVTGEQVFSDVYQFQKASPDNFASAIVEIENRYLNYVVGNTEMILLQKKHMGQICSCYDDVRQMSADKTCPLCYGTSYVGGYYSPEIIKVNFYNPPTEQFKFSPSDNAQDQSILQLWTSNFPLIKAEDILVDKNNIRYIVTSNMLTRKNYYVIRQILAIQMVPKYNIVYSYDIKIR